MMKNKFSNDSFLTTMNQAGGDVSANFKRGATIKPNQGFKTDTMFKEPQQ